MKLFLIALWGGETPPNLDTFLPVATWHWQRMPTVSDAIAETIRDAGFPDRWKWALVRRHSKDRTIHAYQLKFTPAQPTLF